MRTLDSVRPSVWSRNNNNFRYLHKTYFDNFFVNSLRWTSIFKVSSALSSFFTYQHRTFCFLSTFLYRFSFSSLLFRVSLFHSHRRMMGLVKIFSVQIFISQIFTLPHRLELELETISNIIFNRSTNVTDFRAPHTTLIQLIHFL